VYRGQYPKRLYENRDGRLRCLVCGASAALVAKDLGRLFERCEIRGCKNERVPGSLSDRLKMIEDKTKEKDNGEEA